jgi:TadE-like protein
MGAPMLNAWFKKYLTESGQSIVEISLITPILLAALYVPVDFGIAMYTAHLTQNAVREATRIAVSDPDPTKIPFNSAARTAARNEAISRLPARLRSPTVTVNYYGPATATCLQSVEVIASGTYDYFLYQVMHLVGVSVDDTAPITRSSRMWYQFQPVTNTTPACSVPS